MALGVFILCGCFKETVRQKKLFNGKKDFATCEIMFIMRKKIMRLLIMADRVRTGPVRSQAGWPRSF